MDSKTRHALLKRWADKLGGSPMITCARCRRSFITAHDALTVKCVDGGQHVRTTEQAYEETKVVDKTTTATKQAMEPKPAGVKYDIDKLRWDLLPLKQCVEPIVAVLTYGAKKYKPDNWMYVDEPRNRYFAAAMRHLTAWHAGEKNDMESGLPHLAHAATCILFLIWFDKETTT